MSFKLNFTTENSANRGYVSYLHLLGRSSIIQVTSNSSNNNGTYLTKYVIDGDPNTKYSSLKDTNYYQYLQIHFKNSPIYVTAYSMLYAFPTLYNCYPFHWKVLVSNDGNNFEVLDSQNNNRILEDNKQHIFQISPNKQGKYSYFRIINTGGHPIKGCDGHFYLNEFELFGTISSYNGKIVSCQIRTKITHFFIFLIN